MDEQPSQKNGPAAAAILAAALGCATLGIVTVLAEFSPGLKEGLNWWAPAGPLTGKTGIAVLAWLLSWMFLHWRWRIREMFRFKSIFRWALVLIVLGWIGTFPPVFEAFTRH